jgi:hypothetical protein
MGAGGQPGGPDGQAWLQYLSQMYGISPEQAAMMMQNGAPNPANMASPNAQNVNMVDLTSAANGPAGFNPPPGHGDGPAPPPPPVVGNPPAPPPRPIIASSVGQPQPAPQPYGGPMAAADAAGRTTGGLYSHMPAVAGSAAVGSAAPTGTGPAPPVAAPAARVPGPLAGGGAAGTAATSNPRFVGIDAPNFNPQNSMRGGPQATALNLAGLFGGGQGAPAVNPNAPAAAAQPVSAQRPVPGPLANAPTPPVMPPDIRNKRVANAIKDPNWWQNL